MARLRYNYGMTVRPCPSTKIYLLIPLKYGVKSIYFECEMEKSTVLEKLMAFIQGAKPKNKSGVFIFFQLVQYNNKTHIYVSDILYLPTLCIIFLLFLI